jgi:hypothetical protein
VLPLTVNSEVTIATDGVIVDVLINVAEGVEVEVVFGEVVGFSEGLLVVLVSLVVGLVFEGVGVALGVFDVDVDGLVVGVVGVTDVVDGVEVGDLVWTCVTVDVDCTGVGVLLSALGDTDVCDCPAPVPSDPEDAEFCRTNIAPFPLKTDA